MEDEKKKKRGLTDEQCWKLLAMIREYEKNKPLTDPLNDDDLTVMAELPRRLRMEGVSIPLTVYSYCSDATDLLMKTESGVGGEGEEESVFIRFINESDENPAFEGGCMLEDENRTPFLAFRGPKTLEMAIAVFKGVTAVLERELETRRTGNNTETSEAAVHNVEEEETENRKDQD